MTNSSTGRAMYRSLFPDLMQSLFGIAILPLRLGPSPAAADEVLSRFSGVYAWPDRHFRITTTANGLMINGDEEEREALPLDEQTFWWTQRTPTTRR